jgi:hypothetical protein
MAIYIRRCRHNIVQTIKGWTLSEECREAEKQSGSSSRLMWWQQDMDLDKGDDGDADGGGGRDVFPRLFYNEARNKLGVGADPHERFVDRSDAASPDNHFSRGNNLNGYVKPVPSTGQ